MPSAPYALTDIAYLKADVRLAGKSDNWLNAWLQAASLIVTNYINNTSYGYADYLSILVIDPYTGEYPLRIQEAVLELIVFNMRLAGINIALRSEAVPMYSYTTQDMKYLYSKLIMPPNVISLLQREYCVDVPQAPVFHKKVPCYMYSRRLGPTMINPNDPFGVN